MTIPHEQIDKSDEHYTVSMPAYEKIVQEKTRLLAVARAADVYVRLMWANADALEIRKEHDEFAEALAAVEDLL